MINRRRNSCAGGCTYTWLSPVRYWIDPASRRAWWRSVDQDRSANTRQRQQRLALLDTTRRHRSPAESCHTSRPKYRRAGTKNELEGQTRRRETPKSLRGKAWGGSSPPSHVTYLQYLISLCSSTKLKKRMSNTVKHRAKVRGALPLSHSWGGTCP